MHALVKEEGYPHKLWRFQNTLEYRVERLTSYWMNSPSQTDHWLETILLILKSWSVFLISNLVIGVTDLMYLHLLRNILTFSIHSGRNKDQKLVSRFFEDMTFYRLSVSVPLKCTGNWPTKIDFDWPNAEIDWKIANGRL